MRELVVNFDIDVLSSKIQNDESIDSIGRFIWAISHASEEVGLKLVRSIDIDVLSSKIDKEKNLNSVEWIIASISYASEEVGLELVKSVSSKIETEEDFDKWILGAMAELSDDGKSPENVTYKNVLQLTKRLRGSVAQ